LKKKIITNPINFIDTKIKEQKNMQILNSDKNEWYNFDVDNTTTMKTIKEQYAQNLGLEACKLRVWISSTINPNRKKEWIPEADHLTLAECHILIAKARAFIIVKSV
jgi:hypothetical protein